MKRLILILAALVFMVQPSNARGTKITDRSAKDAPEWVYSQPENYLVVEVESSSLSEAKDKALEEISRRIVSAVALNVDHTSSSRGEFNSAHCKITESEDFSYDTQTVAARIPYIKGISLTEAEDEYWEKHNEKKTGRIFYRYCVLYPVSSAELKKMRDEFHKTDSRKEEELKRLEAEIDGVSSASQIERAISQLDELKDYFIDSTRRKAAEGLQRNYKQLYKSLTVEASGPINNSFEIRLKLHGRTFEASGMPTLKANCASRLEAVPLPDSEGFRITYDPVDCLDDEENWIEVSIRMRDARLNKKVFINN